MGDDVLHRVARDLLAPACDEALNIDLCDGTQLLLRSHGMRQERGNRQGVMHPRRFGKTSKVQQMTIVGSEQC